MPKYANLATYNGSFIEQPGYSAYIGCISDSLFPNLCFHYFPFEQIRIYTDLLTNTSMLPESVSQVATRSYCWQMLLRFSDE